MTNATKFPLQAVLPSLMKAKAEDALMLTGQGLPCSVVKVISSGVVKVKFEVNSQPWTLPQVTMPVTCPEYIRYPIQVGDKGRAVPADARLGGVTGLGTGIADLSQPANLSALSFVWLGNKNWSDPIDPNAIEIYGVGTSGVIARSGDSRGKLTVESDSIDANNPAEVDINTPQTNISDNLYVGTAASGTFSTGTGQTITVLGGIIVDIS